ncbi:MAG: PIN domain-containing protein [Mariprofundaceae bacterium]
MKAYVDSDVILDVLLGRDEFLCESNQIFTLCETRKIIGCTTALAIANIHYILSRYNENSTKQAIKLLREIFEVLPISDNEIGQSLNSKFKDFEDGVQNFTAENYDCGLIITRNKKDYTHSRLKVLTPDEYLLATRKNN